MKVQCPQCKASYNINEEKLPDKGANVRCLKCKDKFFITKEARPETESQTRECPRCKVPQEGLEECEYCRFVFGDAKEEQTTPAPQQKETEAKPKIWMRVKTALSWIFGIFFAFSSFILLTNRYPAQGLLFLILAVILIPPVVNKLPFRLPIGVKIAIIIACFVGIPIVPLFQPHQKKTTRTKTTVKQSYKPTKSTSTKRSNQRRITRNQLGAAWPFTVREGILMCKGYRSVVFVANNKTYAVNGQARSQGKYHEINEIWKSNPEIPGTKINIGPIITQGLQLCD